MKNTVVEQPPHSWDLQHWPESVYPHSTSRARYLIRAQRSELLHAGALSRVGRELVVLGARYVKWLEKRTAEVPDYVAIQRAAEQDPPTSGSKRRTAGAARGR